MAIEQGDFIAVLMKKRETVKFGHFTPCFDDIGLEIPGFEPILIKGEDCKILGKVIGTKQETERGSVKVDLI